MTQINLLPWREQARRLKKIRFGMSLLSMVGAAFITVVVLHIYFNSVIGAQQSRNAFLQSVLDQEDGTITALNKKKKEQDVVIKDLQFVFALRGKSYQAVRVLDELSRLIPEDVTFREMKRDDNVVTIIGKAKSNLQVTELMKNMEKSHVFDRPDLTEINAKETSQGEERYFQIKVKLRD